MMKRIIIIIGIILAVIILATPEREITQLSLSEVVTITEVEASIDSEVDNDSLQT